jgi:NADPH:quinone reductase-like Zn-dependent oxidoreductase
MRAAVVSNFGTPPTYHEFPTPAPRNSDDMLVDVLAAGLHPRVRSQANGSHYTSTGQLPLVPGIDGVGRDSDGALRYFILPDTEMGSMAEQTVIDMRRSIVLPADADPVLVAAGMNPAMASWIALRRRIDFQPGQRVLVLGATGNSGRMAVQVAKHLGASFVVGAGRQPQRLAELHDLGADATVSLSGTPSEVAQRLGEVAADVDVVIDFLWGQPTSDAMVALVTNRTDRGQLLQWVEVGSVAGGEAAIPSAALRASRLQVIGSGQGSVPTSDYLAELPELALEIARGTFSVDARVVPLSEVSSVWADCESNRRVVITPGR